MSLHRVGEPLPLDAGGSGKEEHREEDELARDLGHPHRRCETGDHEARRAKKLRLASTKAGTNASGASGILSP